ncbi:MAG: phage replisome organizer N-terminal domain-containing protein [Succiniclasticum sp.]|uniref:phage replisome organizer N-terminal domain-containing protein n=1 Tax=Succiniclasticum sp. TaxID=2775030 RepID=UPI002A90EA4E|nr:phage replisome organizer N-terminal domain-containing protein [Succiniclasticum sp.]MDY6291647.1 phage replisome organizer N-terminal domain-containing protein [Succiniclasticum sp.]
MNHIDPVLDFKTMAAILTANPDGISMIGVWNGMKTLASADPEGCVRLNPGLPMDSAALASLFHCAVGIVEKTIAVFDKIHCLSVTDGLIRITGCGNSNGVPRNAVASEEDKAKKREYNRVRKAAWREKQKQQEAEKTEAKTGSMAKSPASDAVVTQDNVGDNACVPCDSDWDNPVVTCDTTCDTYDSVCDICDTACDSPWDSCDSTIENSMDAGFPQCDMMCDNDCDTGTYTDPYDNNDIYNKHINNYPLPALSADKHITNNYSSLSANKHIKVIPLKNLSETCQRVIREWNKLPLPKYKGLLPALAEKLKFLLQKYGEPTLLKTIAKIADSRFLLGKKGNSTWSASLAWLLEPDHFAKVLSGKYQDDARRSGHKRNRDDWWEPGDPFPFYLPNEDMVAKEGLAALLKPITPAQKRAAQILGLPS